MPTLTATLLAVLLPLLSSHETSFQMGGTSCAPGPTTILEDGEASARVFGAYTARETAAGSTQLCLLVLWRGEVNWHRHRAAVMEAIRKRNPPADDAQVPISLITYSADLGDVALSFDYDWRDHRVEILGDVIDLVDANVVLIDRADRSGGDPVVVRRFRIPPDLTRALPTVKELAMRDADVKAFLE